MKILHINFSSYIKCSYGCYRTTYDSLLFFILKCFARRLIVMRNVFFKTIVFSVPKGIVTILLKLKCHI